MNRLLRFLGLAALLLALAAPVALNAQERKPVDVSTLGPQVGERVPDFALPDQHGRIRTLDSIMGEKGAMILFHRSADW